MSSLYLTIKYLSWIIFCFKNHYVPVKLVQYDFYQLGMAFSLMTEAPSRIQTHATSMWARWQTNWDIPPPIMDNYYILSINIYHGYKMELLDV